MALDTTETSPSPSNGQNTPASEKVDVLGDLKEIASPLKETAQSALEENSELGADKLKTVANAINGAASGLEKEMPQLASFVRDAGNWVEQSAENVRHQKFDALLERAGTFARENPAAAFGIAAVTGFALSRFLKSERPPVNVSSTPQSH